MLFPIKKKRPEQQQQQQKKAEKVVQVIFGIHLVKEFIQVRENASLIYIEPPFNTEILRLRRYS